MKWKGAAPMRSGAREFYKPPRPQPIELAAEITLHLTPFDQKEYRQLIEVRGETIQRVVTRLKPTWALSNAVDAGCGVGFFSQTLLESGLNVRAFDGRAENASAPRRRFTQSPFQRGA